MRTSLIPRLTVPVLALLASTAPAQREISVKTLLPEMVDLQRLARRPSPYYKEAQASSYDRARVAPDKPGWFANGDAGQFVRFEENGGRKEAVLADLKGPGAVVRFWSANPSGTVRFYFDGSQTPGIECPLVDLLTGKIAPMVDPFAYVASSGCDLYFPIPYAKSLKVTVQDPGGLYYHIGYRTYEPGTVVRTFTMGSLREVTDLAASVGRKLLNADLVESDRMQGFDLQSIAPGATRRVVSLHAARQGSQIVLLRAKINDALPEDGSNAAKWADPKAIQNALRNVILKIDFDGERCVESPIGDFFSTAPGINPHVCFPMQVYKDGWMVCRFVMPFRHNAVIRLSNVGPVPASLSFQVMSGAAPFGNDSYHFHAQWTVERSRTRPFKDMHFLTVKGEGQWIGVNVHVANPVPDWWGEGDEKVWVDDDKFPSTVGTGTEDYFGYAWCDPHYFTRPYHAEPRADGPNNFGHTNVVRWQIFDCIPYAKSLQFDMELWHWADVTLNYARTAYWCAKPGGTSPLPVVRSLLAPPFLTAHNKVEGALEGEALKYTKTGGGIDIQTGFFEASAGKQLFWHNPSIGDKLDVTVPVAAAGDYEVVLGLGMAADYGIHKIRLIGGSDDARETTLDLYGEGIHFKPFSLGVYHLPAGEVTLEVTPVGKNPSASAGYMFGLDYVLLKRK
jgi:hypothetical protein